MSTVINSLLYYVNNIFINTLVVNIPIYFMYASEYIYIVLYCIYIYSRAYSSTYCLGRQFIDKVVILRFTG